MAPGGLTMLQEVTRRFTGAALLAVLTTGCAGTGQLGGGLTVGPQAKPTPPPATRDLTAPQGAVLKLEVSGLTSPDLAKLAAGLMLTGPVAVPPALPSPTPTTLVTVPLDPTKGVWVETKEVK